MGRRLPIKALFLDVGGVLLTDGWDHRARRRAAAAFELELAPMEERHQLIFETFEAGSVTLDDYLRLVVFWEARPFTRAQFRRFMFAQSHPHKDMLDLVGALRARHRLKVVVVSNEARELNQHRIRAFRLGGIVDTFVSSCFVHIRKPDAEIFRIALDVAQTPPRQVLYVDNTPMFVSVAERLGIRSVLHTSYRSTKATLESFGLDGGPP